MMMVVALAGCGVAMVLALVRAAKGPTAFDRVLAVNAIGTLVILGIALHGFIMGRPEFVDISILYAVSVHWHVRHSQAVQHRWLGDRGGGPGHTRNG